MAGINVGFVALPLSMALAVATGAPPQTGLYTSIMGGIAVAIFGGSRIQISGPTAAFVVILAPLVAQYGLHGAMITGFLAGLMLIGMGLIRFGALIKYIPHPVTAGYNTGIAVLIATQQLKEFFGLRISYDAIKTVSTSIRYDGHPGTRFCKRSPNASNACPTTTPQSGPCSTTARWRRRAWRCCTPRSSERRAFWC